MEYQSFLIKYGEIGIKGKNRYLFEDTLVKRIRGALLGLECGYKAYKSQGRIHVDIEDGSQAQDVIERLSCVFGITGICPVQRLEDAGLEMLKEEVCRYVAACHPEEELSFKVQARRGRKNYPLNSMELGAELGAAILEAYPNRRVDVRRPDWTLYVEIREHIYLYSTVLPGPGGMPVGTGGKAMLLLSGGIDSPVAGYMVAKRGVELEAVYFHAPPYTSERAKDKVVELARIISRYTGPIRLHIINFTAIQLHIYEKCPHDELTIIMRRFMMSIAQDLALEAGALGLVTGESIGQVASQTMQALAATDNAVDMPVYRPLIAFDKQEIVEKSWKIGSFETSILSYEDCCTIFVAKHPVTKPSLKRICLHEKNLYPEVEAMVAEAKQGREILDIG